MSEQNARVGRLIVDSDDVSGTDVSFITKAINRHTRFTAERSTPMRIDLFEDADSQSGGIEE